LARKRRFDGGNATERGVSLALRENFRSGDSILRGINLVFGALMRGDTGIVRYDSESELVPGTLEQTIGSVPIEVHLLERRFAEDEQRGEPGSAPRSADDPGEWEAVQRESYVIGSVIRRLVESKATRRGGEPIRFRDVAVLLRAAVRSAGAVTET